LCNPKSSTGRLDIFFRTIVNLSDEYEKIPLNYSGEIFIEITSRSFDIEFQAGDSLNQMRLVYFQNNYINDNDLIQLHSEKPILFDKNNKEIKPYIDYGLKVSVDLSDKNSINAYKAKKNSPILNFSKTYCHNKNDYWLPIETNNNSLIIEQNNFYILKSKEKIRIPTNTAGEMIPYDTGLGDFRAHYAGFFDPGFGDPNGSFAVLEVKTNEVPFLLEDGQTIARIKYEKLNKETSMVYGKEIKSNYQNQSLALNKHFV
jgi:Deoxycytidine deaminase